MDITQSRAQLSAKRHELNELKTKLSQASRIKEETSRELRSLHDKIKSRSLKISALKEERNALTDEVKKIKGERDHLNSSFKEALAYRQSVDAQRHVLPQPSQRDPHKIKVRLKQLEAKLETEVMPFEKEKSLTKEIKELRRQYQQFCALGEINREISSATLKYSQARQQAQLSHLEVQKKAQMSQTKHEEINKLYDELKSFRDQERPLSEKFAAHRKAWEDLKSQTESLQSQITELAKLCSDEDDKIRQSHITKKTAEVKERFKKGGKLSTADILALQAIDDNDTSSSSTHTSSDQS